MQTNDTMAQCRTFARAIVTDLVDKKLISNEIIRFEGGAWTVVRPVLGFNSARTFQSRDELVDALTDSVLSTYGGSIGGLRAAV